MLNYSADIIEAFKSQIATRDLREREAEWEPDVDLLYDLLRERRLEIEDQSAPSPQSPRQNNGGDPHPILAAALGYAAERDWELFPAKIVGKTKKSHKSAEYSGGAKWGKTRDPEQIRKDFTRWPDANVGIPTGKDNRIWVFETDTPEGHNVDGEAALRELEAEHGPLPNTLTAISPSGSKHRYFNHPGGDIEIKNSVSEIAPGVDVRGDGGMVIAPPSVRKDGTYRWLNDLPIADAPGWLC